MVALAFCDLEKRLLPDEFTLGGLLTGIVFAFLVPWPSANTVAGMFFMLAGSNASDRVQSVAESLLAAGVLSGILWAAGAVYLKIRGREGLGFGDVKLVAMIGAFLGFQLALASMAWGGVAGSVIGLVYIWATHKDASTFELPYGTFLSVAAVITAILSV
jgi:leader peptidase (prepilin peptidase)/N-methyltransferase